MLIASTAQAQDEGAKVGIGVSLIQGVITPDLEGGEFFGSLGLGNIYLPIVIGTGLKIEPELGILRSSETQKDEGFEDKFTFTQWRFGLGLFYMFPATESLRAYVGPRFGLLLNSATEEFTFGNATSKDEFDETDFSVGLALGGEHFFSDNFSLGGEVQLNYLIRGEPTVKQDGEEDPDPGELDRNLIANTGLILLRWYF